TGADCEAGLVRIESRQFEGIDESERFTADILTQQARDMFCGRTQLRPGKFKAVETMNARQETGLQVFCGQQAGQPPSCRMFNPAGFTGGSNRTEQPG
ncbi:MAG: hypothetical protein ACK55I_06755, partial [bacterium]